MVVMERILCCCRYQELFYFLLTASRGEKAKKKEQHENGITSCAIYGIIRRKRYNTKRVPRTALFTVSYEERVQQEKGTTYCAVYGSDDDYDYGRPIFAFDNCVTRAIL